MSKFTKVEEIEYLHLMLTATAEDDSKRLAAINKRLKELDD